MSRKIWGFEISRTPSGRNIWPLELKQEAVRRMTEEKQPPADLAREIGANDCMVRRWLHEDQARDSASKDRAVSFVQIELENRHEKNAPILNCSPASTEVGEEVCFSFGKLSLQVPLEIDEAVLKKLLRAMSSV